MMVLFAHQVAKTTRRIPGFSFKKTAEVRRILKMQMVGDVFAGIIGEQQQPLSLQQDSLENYLGRGHTSSLLAMTIEVTWGKVEHFTVILNLVVFPKMLFNQVFIIRNDVVLQGIGLGTTFKFFGNKKIALFEDDADVVLNDDP